MPKFRKKPVVIEAMQLRRGYCDVLVDWIGPSVAAYNLGEFTEDACYIDIKTLEGVMTASEGDWVIQGVKGEFYPCRDDIFRMTYEAVLDAA